MRTATFVFMVVWCITKQGDRNGETVKHFYNCIKVLWQFRTPYCANLRQYSNRPKRSGAHDDANHTYNFRFQLLHQKIVSAYHFAVVCYNNHVQDNMLTSNRFTSIQGKTISWLSEFRVSLQNFRVSFWHLKTASKNTGLNISTEKYKKNYRKPQRNFLSACSVVTSWK